MPLTPAQTRMMKEAGRSTSRYNIPTGQVELRGSAAFQVAHRLEGLGFGQVQSSQAWRTSRFTLMSPADLVKRWKDTEKLFAGPGYAAERKQKIDADRLSKNLTRIVWPADEKVNLSWDSFGVDFEF